MPPLPDLLKRAAAGEVIDSSDPFAKPKTPQSSSDSETDNDTQQKLSTIQSQRSNDALSSVLGNLHLQQMSR